MSSLAFFLQDPVKYINKQTMEFSVQIINLPLLELVNEISNVLLKVFAPCTCKDSLCATDICLYRFILVCLYIGRRS